LQIRLFLAFTALLIACFSQPFLHLVRFALAEDLFSYVLLIPFISVYLAWIRRKDLPHTSGGRRWPAAIPAAAALALLVATQFGSVRAAMDASGALLPFQMLSFCCLLWSAGFLLLGTKMMRSLAFPFLFLVFVAPIPPSIVASIETALQHASAEVSYRFIQLAGIPVFRFGLDFHMPRIAISVAQECSGIRSTLVLFMSALVAGHMFLRKAWTRWILVLIVIPLGIARNAFRVLVLAWLCVRVDVSYIYSPIHTRGGPLFFVLSLIPFVALLFWLRRTERGGRH
jgi:exosortase C (VPDSG-CTERM-specific)